MKSILISIKPKWVAKILNSEKTIEIRKTMPKCDLPIDVYIYCTKEEELFYNRDTQKWVTAKNRKNVKRLSNGVVKAKFTLNKVEEINTAIIPNLELELEEDEKYRFAKKTKLTDSLLATDFLKMSCLSIDDLNDYFVKWEYDELFGEELNISDGYAWHISNLVIFDKPKELSEFRHDFVSCKKYCDNNLIPSFCRLYCSHNEDDERLNVYCNRNDKWGKPLAKAPQSWCYVEVLL